MSVIAAILSFQVGDGCLGTFWHRFRSLFAWPLLLAMGSACALAPTQDVSQYAVKAWTMEDGLSHNLVHAVAQDAEGYLWVGSWEGVTRFNGRHFTAFDERNLTDIPLIGVRTILRDTDDAMLFGTAQHGVIRFADGVWSKLQPTVTQSLRVIILHRALDGSLWIGTDRNVRRLWPDGRLDTVAANDMPYGVIYAFQELGRDDMLIGSEHGLFRFHDGQLENLTAQRGLDAAPIRALLKRQNGELVAAGDLGAYTLGSTGPARRILDRSVESVLEDSDGTLWLGISSGGLVRWQHDQIQTLDASEGLLGRNSQALMEDREGLLWVGTTNGLFRISDAPAFGLNRTRGLGDNYPRTILQHAGQMYVGHARGLDVWRNDHFEPIPLGERETSVLALASAHDGGLWVGTYDRGVLHLDLESTPNRVSSIIIEQLPSHHVRALYESADGSLWIGTTAGVMRRHPDGRIESIEDSPGRSNSFVRGLAPTRDGGIWIGLGNGLMRWHPDGTIDRWLADFPGIGAFDALEDDDGNVWIGSDHGLLRLREGHFTRYDRDQGLPNDTLFRVLQDASGALWLASNHGAFRIDPRQFDEIDAGVRKKLTIEVLNHASGMPSSQCNGGSGPAGDFDTEGRLWLPTALGVAVIDPKAVTAHSRFQVPIRIETVQVDSSTVPVSEVDSLAPSVNRVVVHYVSLYLRDPLGIRYRYRMLGFDSDWIEAGNAIDAVYTNLPSGLLRFEVQATLAPLGWDDQHDLPTASFEIKRIPPFWRQPWFYALLPFGLLALSLIVFFWHSARSRQRQHELARLVEMRTRELREKNEALLEADRERESLLQRLAWQASHDALTGLPNRRAGERRLDEAIRVATTTGQPLSVALLDLDHFKRINDTWGHKAGDATLKHVTSLLIEYGDPDIKNLSRYGGEEFLLILPGFALEQACKQMQTLIKAIADSRITLPDGQHLGCTASIGVAHWHPGQTSSQIVVQADRLLYRGKEQGRNQAAC